MTHDDADAVLDLTLAAWGAGDRRTGRVRIDHLIDTDPDGAWVTTDDDGVVDGAALALVREGLWGLSLLIVHADRQSAGRGRELLRAVTAYGADAEAGIVMGSNDPRALRSYWRMGFELRPALDASGDVRSPPPADPSVRAARWPGDRELVDSVSRFVRGASHGPDVDAMLAQGRRFLVHDGGGYAVVADARVAMVAATDERVAAALLRTALAELPTVEVNFLDARQRWAIDIVLEAGLAVVADGATCVRGAVGPMVPYIPSGAYL